jgi:hypothetical protein
MKRRILIFAAATALAGGAAVAAPAWAEAPMSPIYRTTGQTGHAPPATRPAIASSTPAAEKPAPPAAPASAKTATAAAKEDAAGPVFEAAIPPPAAATPGSAPPAAATVEPSPPPAQKTAAAPKRPRRSGQSRYVRTAPLYYAAPPAWPSGYSAPQRGWGGGRYGPSPYSEGQ